MIAASLPFIQTFPHWGYPSLEELLRVGTVGIFSGLAIHQIEDKQDQEAKGHQIEQEIRSALTDIVQTACAHCKLRDKEGQTQEIGRDDPHKAEVASEDFANQTPYDEHGEHDDDTEEYEAPVFATTRTPLELDILTGNALLEVRK